MEPGDSRRMVLDACVLIDYLDAAPHVLSLYLEKLNPICTLCVVIEEIDETDSGELVELGIQVITPHEADNEGV